MPEFTNRSFTSGEIAPALRSRVDLGKYATGLAKCENFIVRPQGGVYSRPGLKYIGDAYFHNSRSRLIPFSFNTEQTYVLVFSDLSLRIIKNGGYILDGGVPLLVTTPYTVDQLDRLSYTQDADIMTIVHPDHPPKNLSRTSDTSWTLANISFTPTVSSPTLGSNPGLNYAITGISNTAPAVVTTTGDTSILSVGDGITLSGVVDDNTSGNNTLEAEVNGLDGTGKAYVISAKTATTITLENTDFTTLDGYASGGTINDAESVAVGTGAGDFPKRYLYRVTTVDADGVESVATNLATIYTPSLSVTAGVRIDWQSETGADYYRVYKDTGGGFFGWIGDASGTSFTDYNLAPITSDAPPQDRDPFSGTNNRPATVTYYQQRQVYANTYNEPQTVFTTQTANYNSMRTSSPSRADDAVTFTVRASQVNEIRHIIPLDALILMTSGGEWRVSEGQDQVLTPSTVGVRIQSYNGSAWVRPVVANSTAIYVQEKGNRVRDLAYQFSADNYTGNDLSLMSEHLFEGTTITDMAFAQEPYGVLWCVRSDGALLGLTYQKEHQVWGWHVHTTDGSFESITTISEDGRDAVYVVVNRTINGATKRYVERLETRDLTDATTPFCVDSGLSYNGSPATSISGLDHLEGESVSVLADGNEVTGLTVSSGSITLPYEASVVHVGLPYTSVIETLDLDTASPQGSLKPHEISVSKVTIEVEKSRGGWVGPKQDDGTTGDLLEIKPRDVSDGYGAATLKTFKQEIHISMSWQKTGGLRVEQRSPLPLAILSITPRFDIGG